MIKCRTTEERELGYDSIVNILKDKVNGATLDCVGVSTGLHYFEGGQEIHERMGRITMTDGNKNTEILLTPMDMAGIIEYMAHELRNAK
jgi:hypothetical protein